MSEHRIQMVKGYNYDDAFQCELDLEQKFDQINEKNKQKMAERINQCHLGIDRTNLSIMVKHCQVVEVGQAFIIDGETRLITFINESGHRYKDPHYLLEIDGDRYDHENAQLEMRLGVIECEEDTI